MARPGYRARRWPLYAAATTAAALAVLALFVSLHPSGQQATFQTLPDPRFSQPAPDAGQSSVSDASARPGVRVAPVQEIPASRAKQIYIPNIDRDLVISTAVNPMDDCRRVIDPPRDAQNLGGVFGCSDFAQPGTDTRSLSVVAGHSARSIPTAFNRLYAQGQSLTGREVFLKTAASGKRWLVYRIQHVYVVKQKDLPYMTQVWGGPTTSTAGRLVLVTCRQRPGVTPADENYVAVGQFMAMR